MCKVQINNEEIEFSDIKIVPLFDRVRILGKHHRELQVIKTKEGQHFKKKFEYYASFLEILDFSSFMQNWNNKNWER